MREYQKNYYRCNKEKILENQRLRRKIKRESVKKKCNTNRILYNIRRAQQKRKWYEQQKINRWLNRLFED